MLVDVQTCCTRWTNRQFFRRLGLIGSRFSGRAFANPFAVEAYLAPDLLLGCHSLNECAVRVKKRKLEVVPVGHTLSELPSKAT